MGRVEVEMGTTAREVKVLEKATRRRYKGEEKRRILQEADACTQPGEVGGTTVALSDRCCAHASNSCINPDRQPA